MLKIISLILLLGTSPVLAQIGPIQGHSFLGGTQAVTSGLKSSNYMQGIVPSATICVYNTGTTVPATIYANASGAPLSSCFTSNASISTDPGGWIFWAAINQGLDVVMSGGVSPNMYPAPVTISDLYPSTQITGCVFGTVCPISQGGTGATTAAGAVVNIVNGQVITPAAVTTATRTIDCAAYSTLALCWAAAQTYVTTNETGSGRAVRLLLHDQTYTISGSLAVYSGMQVVGVQPRLAANGSTIWQSPTPNGGTWINCGGGNCLTGGNSSGLTGVSLTNLGFTNFTNAMTFGGSGVNGLSNSVLTQIYFIGAATCCTADTGLVEYNGNFLQISGMYGYNVNTVFDFENASPVGLISGNSNIYDLYAYTYGKSAANGNNAKPGIKFGGGVNLINVYRPQVNTYSGDNTGVGIEISASAMIHLFDADTEGNLLHGIWLTNNSTDNTIELAIGAGTTDPNYIQIDSGSQYNTIRSSNSNSGFTLSGTALGFNFGYFPGFITDGDVGITFQDSYGAGTLFIGNGTLGDWSGTLNVANLAISQTGGTTYQVASGNLRTRATGSLGIGAYGADLVFLQKDTFITADNAFEPGTQGAVDLGGYNQGWAHGFFEHLDQAEAGSGNQYAGQCTVAATPATSCTITIQHAYTDGSLCFASPYSPYTGTGQAACNLSGTTITITTPVAIATTLSWNAFIVGNPF